MKASLISCEATYSQSDSWLLYAVIHASKSEPADLAKIIAVGDHYNHAVFTHDELYGGLDRLIGGSWIVSKEKHFSAADQAIKLYATIQRRELSCYDEMKLLEVALNSKGL